MFPFLFIYVPRGTYSKCGMNIFLFTQDIDLFREMFIYITQHYTRNTAISQEKVLSAHFAAFSLPDSSPTSADAAPSCPAIPAAALRARFPSLRSPARAPRPLLPPLPQKSSGNFFPSFLLIRFRYFRRCRIHRPRRYHHRERRQARLPRMLPPPQPPLPEL